MYAIVGGDRKSNKADEAEADEEEAEEAEAEEAGSVPTEGDAAEVEEEETTQDTEQTSQVPLSLGPGQTQLDKDHPRQASHALVERDFEVVPRVSGKRLPDSRLLQEKRDDSVKPITVAQRAELRESFASAALVMFMPWRTLSDLKGEDESWWAAYQRTESNFSSESLAILRNMQSYHDSFVRKADEEELPYDKVAVDPGHKEADCSDDEEAEDTGFGSDAVTERHDIAKGDLAKLPFLRKLMETDFSFVSAQSLQQAQGESVGMQEFKEAVALGHAKPSTLPVEDEEPVLVISDVSPHVLCEIVIGACMDISGASASPTPFSHLHDKLKERPSIGEGSRNFSLNPEQHRAFVLLASALLEGLVRDVADDDVPLESLPTVVAARVVLQKLLACVTDEKSTTHDDPSDQKEDASSGRLQLRFFLSGPAGTGKSTVIQALVAFAKQWKARDALCLTATSGIAGVNIEGQTYQKAMGMGFDSGQGADDDEEVTQHKTTANDKEKWSRIRLVVIDEVSMMGAHKLNDIDGRLKRLLSNFRAHFGGMHMAFFGDIFQLGPVSATSLFGHRAGAGADSKKQVKPSSLNGIKLWHALNACLELETPMRQASDPEYAASLDRLRTNQPVVDDLKMVNTLMISRLRRPPDGSSFVTSLNKPRGDVNANVFKQFCQVKLRQLGDDPQACSWQDMGAIRILTEFTRVQGKGRAMVESGNINVRTLQQLYRFEDKDLHNVTTHLDLILGSRVLVTDNISVSNGIANGTSATLVQILLDEDEVRWSVTAKCFVIKASSVHGLILKNLQKPFDERDLYPPLGKGNFPVQRLTSTKSLINCVWNNGKLVRKPKYVRAGVKTHRFRVCQFPVIPKHVLTTHKMQGQTCESLVMLPLDDRHKHGQGGLLYVNLSRVRSREQMYLTEPITEDVSLYVPRTKELEEMKWLRTNLVHKTTARLDALMNDQLSGNKRKELHENKLSVPPFCEQKQTTASGASKQAESMTDEHVVVSDDEQCEPQAKRRRLLSATDMYVWPQIDNSCTLDSIFFSLYAAYCKNPTHWNEVCHMHFVV